MDGDALSDLVVVDEFGIVPKGRVDSCNVVEDMSESDEAMEYTRGFCTEGAHVGERASDRALATNDDGV